MNERLKDRLWQSKFWIIAQMLVHMSFTKMLSKLTTQLFKANRNVLTQ